MRNAHDQDNAAYVREVHDKGLQFDLQTMSRRRLLAALGGVGALAALGACSDDSASTSSSSGTASTSASSASGSLTEVASETNGPYPADGSNGPDVRTIDGVVRKDITKSFGDADGVAEGIPLEFSLVVTDLSGSPINGAAIYAWHCDRDGNYSLYSTGITEENYLRGIQATDATGTATFTSIFPGCYSGRWPHIHFEVYGSLENATNGDGPIVKTSQIALTEESSKAVYATDGYSKSVTNLSQITIATDNVFSDDNAATEMATVTGSVTEGYKAVLKIAIDPSDEESGGGSAPGGGTPPSGGPGGAPPSGGPGGPPPSGAPPAN
jgi:protocatechuate 3,4-dioxygenase beta subunit